MLYTNSHRDPQADFPDVENLSLEDKIVASAFWRLRDPEPFGETQARHAILYGFDHGHWGATETFNALEALGLFGDVEFFVRAFSAGVAALSSERRLPPSDLPPAAPGMRSEPSREDLEATRSGNPS
jgi:hypothetical protein